MDLVPRPVSVRTAAGAAVLGSDSPITAGPGLDGVAALLRGVLRAGPAGGTAVHLRVDAGRPAEGYALTVRPTEVEIAGGSPAGVARGVQTLRQLLPPDSLRAAGPDGTPWTVPAVEITDAPKFAWRGVMLDVARHFMPVADVLRFIDVAALHKLNVLHLHLTDDQGWRVEVPGWPRLTEAGSWRTESMLGSRGHERYDGRPHGGYYTAGDLREIVAFAAVRQVTVVPEIDMPGHMQAAVAAYPHLGNGFEGGVRTGWGISSHVLNVGETAMDFCRRVLDHVCDIFPSELIGIGGDECPAEEWAAAGLAEPHRIQARFTAEMAAHLAKRGRRIYGWDEILAGGAPAGATVAAWRGVEPTRVAARAGHPVVACPDIKVYLDYRQSDDPGEPTPVGTLLTLDDVYRFDPVPDGLTAAEAALVLGGQANVWTEHMESARRVDYMTYPRLCALAEALWQPGDLANFRSRLPGHLERLGALGVNYRPLDGPRPWDARPDAPGNPRDLDDRLRELHEMTADLRGTPVRDE